MKSSHITYIGGILFFMGLIFIIISWNFTYPIYIPGLNNVTFTQFHPTIWPGMMLSLIGLFLTGYFSRRKSVKAICASFFPIILYSYVFYFSYVPSSDCGDARSIFEVFHHVGINPAIVPYFQYPTYFSLNEITSQTLGLDVKGIAYIFFAFYGILLGLYLFVFLSKISKNNHHRIAFLGILIYFTAIFPFLNYQWVPQTLALVFFFLLLILFDRERIEYTLLKILIFTALVFTHAFIPVLFLLFFGLNALKKRRSTDTFLIMACIYCSILIYYSTFYFSTVIETFRQSIYGFGGEYSTAVSKSFMEPSGLINQIISFMNRIRVPLTWFVISTGIFIGFIKKKLSYPVIALGITGGIYLGIGIFYSILGLRALQILFVPMVIGINFFICKWKKLTLVFVAVLLVLSIFGPMRSVYDETHFQLDEEKNACDFLANGVSSEEKIRIAAGQINWGYFTKIYTYLKGVSPIALRSGNQGFFDIFNESMEKNDYVIYNSNLGKEIILRGTKKEEITDLIEKILLNNRIYESGKTFIVKGR